MIIQPAAKFIFSIRNRAARSPRGSVLIIVIVLLLLLAILGTAYLATSRADRITSAQSLLNAQADAQLEGIANAVSATIMDDLNDATAPPAGPLLRGPDTLNYRGQFSATATAFYKLNDVVNDPANPSAFYVYVNPTPMNGTVALLYPPPAPPTVYWLPVNRDAVTGPGFQPWVASRIPSVPTLGNPAAFTSNAPYWPNISQTLTATTPLSVIGTPFESPDGTTVAFPSPEAPYQGFSTNASGNAQLYPYFGAIGGTAVPTLSATPPNGTPPALPLAATFIAADADGDGIADSLLFRIPGDYSDDLTWYAAIRIVDNNAAINANTAWSRDQDYTLNSNGSNPSTYNEVALPNWGFFPSDVGLLELLQAADTTGGAPNDIRLAFNQHRFGDTVDNIPIADSLSTNLNAAIPDLPYDETGFLPGAYPAPPAQPPTAATAFPASLERIDFGFISEGDALYHQFSRRIDNPGFNIFNTTSNTYTRYQALPASDAAALASHFCLANTSGEQSLIEKLLPNSLLAGGTPFGDPVAWYNANFNFPAAPAANTLPIRPLLVTRNPVTNYIAPKYSPSHPGEPMNFLMLPYGIGDDYNILAPPPTSYNHFRGNWNNAITYNLNDIVVFAPGNFPAPYTAISAPPTPTAPGYTYICVSTVNVGVPPETLAAGTGDPTFNSNVWQLQPWSQHPAKANVNTATFRELFRAYWLAMSGPTGEQTPFGYTALDLDAYDNRPYNAATVTGNPQGMFRSQLRDPTAANNTANVTLMATTANAFGVTNTNAMLLRAAIAAVNAMGLRDESQNVISRTVGLQATVNIGGTPTLENVEARVFSSVPEPIISEVFADNDNGSTDPNAGGHTNPSGYVAVEIYNPYPFTMSLAGWQLGVVNRGATGTYPNLNFQAQGSATVDGVGPHLVPLNNIITDPAAPVAVVAAFAPTVDKVLIPPYGYALLENYSGGAPFVGAPPAPPGVANPSGAVLTTLATPNDAQYRPISSGIAGSGVYAGNAVLATATPALPYAHSNTVDVWVTGLQDVLASATPNSGGELVLLRMRRADGAFSSSTDPLNTFTEFNTTTAAPNLYELVPVDSYDFTGITQTAAPGIVYSYVRPKDVGAVDELFKGTYPGKYDATPSAGPGLPQSRHRGTLLPISPPPVVIVPANPAMASFSSYSAGTYTDLFPPVQISNTDTAGKRIPNPVVAFGGAAAANPQKYPFGAFARNGDMLDVPFVGAYRIRISGPTNIQVGTANFLELNSLPMDCAMAALDDGAAVGTSIDTIEQIGRFCPLMAQPLTATFPTNLSTGIYADPCFWTRNLFNYLTVQSNNDDYLPNFDPGPNDLTAPAAASVTKYPPGSAAPLATPPSPVFNADATANTQTSQDNVGVDGLININTASWKVLSMLPLVPNPVNYPTPATYTANYAAMVTDNENLAKLIVTWRDGIPGDINHPSHGPFLSIYDLNQVVETAAGPNLGKGFQNAYGHQFLTYSAPSSAVGAMTPADPLFPNITSPTPATSPVSQDYQWDFLTLNRVSNLITTRSDNFTVYVVVEGWQNAVLPGQPAYVAGNPNPPQMKVLRRFAFIADRSAINSDLTSRFLKTITVPSN